MSNPFANKRIMVLDDDAAVVDYLCESLNAEGYQTEPMTSSLEALERLRRDSYDLVISDVEMPNLRGTDLLKAILESNPRQLVLLITAFGSVEMAVEAVRAGACDFLTKPFKIEALLHATHRAFADRMLRREVVRLRAAMATQGEWSTVAKSPAMIRVLHLATRAAGSAAPILLTGESGSGKTHLARFIHQSSARRDEPFVQLNCAALPASLAESELFGVRKGAFTDAREDRSGLFVAAKGGTIFLDEVGELPLEVQAKLLHVLESGMVRPLGGDKEVPVHARVITATNQVPEALVRDGRFRADLYYRINVIRIEVPPLRERRDDIPALVDRLLESSHHKQAHNIVGVSARAMKQLMSYRWPGNVRELINVLERAVAMAEHDTILPEDLDFGGGDPGPTAGLTTAAKQGLSLEELEQAYVQRVLEEVGGNKAAAARVLGITRRTLYRKLDA